jgi:hypothetical protein
MVIAMPLIASQSFVDRLTFVFVFSIVMSGSLR